MTERSREAAEFIAAADKAAPEAVSACYRHCCRGTEPSRVRGVAPGRPVIVRASWNVGVPC
jgi:hypothetical protein